ncbi:hypothetical protein BBI08_03815 [Planococcus halocryophilus]|uniref:Uncharacterized protein n=1 Tax=Planococcus halocryophilus TaxID=1215089 RepID=A0A1C7DP73_9BACL|nr:hypothetical protein BBI08_03815 [Planococcus halocryophilus]
MNFLPSEKLRYVNLHVNLLLVKLRVSLSPRSNLLLAILLNGKDHLKKRKEQSDIQERFDIQEQKSNQIGQKHQKSNDHST